MQQNNTTRIYPKSIQDVTLAIKNYSYVSFDLFDTLITRLVVRPSDIHKIVEIYAKKITNNYKYNHYQHRMHAEKLERVQSIYNEITLDSIYKRYILMTGVPAHQVKKIQEYEEETELNFIVARNSGKILFDYAINENINVIITSDFYIGKEFIKKCLKKCGYDTKGIIFFISCEHNASKQTGDLYKVIQNYKFPELKFNLNKLNKKILHIGDNFNADVLKALENGVDAIHFPSSITVQENSKGSYEFFKNIFGKQFLSPTEVEYSIIFALIIRNRFDNPYNISHKVFPDDYFDIGLSIIGPIILSFTLWLIQNIKIHKINKLLFVSRDGFILKKFYDIIQKHDEALPKSKYLLASRRIINLLLVSQDFNNISNIVDTRISPCTIKFFLEQRLGLDESMYDSSILDHTGFSSLDSIISLPKDKIFILRLLQNIRKEIEKSSKKYTYAYKQYLHNIINTKDDIKIGIVDIGYFGTTQKAITNLLCDKKIYGFYIATRKEMHYDNSISSKSFAYLETAFSPLDLHISPISKKLGILESILTAPHGSLYALNNYNNHIYFKYSHSDIEKLQYLNVSNIHKGIYSFAKQISKHIEYLLFFNGKGFHIALSNILNTNSKEFKLYFSNFILENTYCNELNEFKITDKTSTNHLEQNRLIDNSGNFHSNIEQMKYNNIYQKYIMIFFKSVMFIFLKKKYYKKLDKHPILFFKDSRSILVLNFIRFYRFLGKF